tara:strand:+ start:19646 stop:20347 length:702 start_codon:yes stop_codon:yes gene_type:complete
MTNQILGSSVTLGSKPRLSYGFQNGATSQQQNGIKALENWQDQQVTLNNSMGGGSSTDGYTKVEVPQTDVFNPAGPDGPNSASQGANLNNLTAQNQGIFDELAFQQNEPTYNPPPAPAPEKILDSDTKKGGAKNRKTRKSMSKTAFCTYAKKRSKRRISFLKAFKKQSKIAYRSRNKHINRYCTAKKKMSFCKSLKSFSRRRIKSDNKFTRKQLKRALKRRTILLKHCKDLYY